MIPAMIKIVADAITGFVEAMSELAILIWYCLVFLLVIATCPIWIIPYLAWRNIKEAKEDEQR